MCSHDPQGSWRQVVPSWTWPHACLELLRVFFDSCDGFFTNYNWREDHLQRMVAQAGERLADVYVGVDVFARSNVVGGRFDTDKVGGGLCVGETSILSSTSGGTEAPWNSWDPSRAPSSCFNSHMLLYFISVNRPKGPVPTGIDFLSGPHALEHAE